MLFCRPVTMKMFMLMLFFGISTLSVAEGNKATQQLEPVRLQLKWFHDFVFAGYYAAIEQGYYEQENLDVTLVERDLDKSVVQQVVTGESDYGIAGSGLLSEYANGQPVKALAAIFQHDPLAYFTLQNSGIVSPYEMAGKRIMTDTLSADQAPLISLLSEAHFKHGDYTLVEQNNEYEQLIDGRVDVISGYITDQPFFYQEQNTNINIIRPFNYGIDFYGDILFTSETEVTQHPDRVERFIRASLKGWDYALNHPDEIIDLIKNTYHSPLSEAHLRFEVDEIYKLIRPDIIALGQIEPARLKAIAQTHSEGGFNRNLTDQEINAFVYQAQTSNVTLTKEEKAWLAKHPVIRVGVDRDFAPYEWIDNNGDYQGMVSEYLGLIAKNLGIQFEIVGNRSWAEILKLAEAGELDMLSAAAPTPERQKFLKFVKPYKSAPVIIIDGGRNDFIGNLDNLKGKRVSIEKGYFMEEVLSTNYPDIELVETSNSSDALKAVAKGDVDAYVGDAGVANYLIRKEGMLNIRFSGQTPYYSEQSLAINQQYPELYSIMTKAIAAIEPEQVDAMFNRWLGLNIEQGVKIEAFAKYIIAGLVFLLIFSLWVIRLRLEIAKREQAEKREKSRGAALELMAKSTDVKKTLTDIIKMVEADNPHMKCSVLLYNEESGRLHSGVAPSLPDFYNQAVDGIKAGLNIGSCGTAAFLRKRVIVEDIQTHPYWQNYKTLAAKAKLASCWSEPILSSQNRILGTFGIYQSVRALPSKSEIALIEELAKLSGIAIEKHLSDLAMQQSEEHLKLVIDTTPLCVTIINRDRELLQMNPAGLAMIQARSLDEVLYEDVNQLMAPSSRKAFNDFHYKVCQNQSGSLSFEIITMQGERRWVESYGVAIKLPNSSELAHLAVTHDITNRKQNEDRLQLASKVFSHAREGILISDADANIIDVNETYCEMSGYSRDELIGQNPRIINSGLHDSEFYKHMWEVLGSEGSWTGEVWNRHKNGDVFPVLETISSVRDQNGRIQHYVALCSDITQMKEHQRQLEHIANFDVLTGLPNRVLLSDRLDQAISACDRHKKPLVVGFLDLDGFKEINDQYGHKMGDDLLITVSKRMLALLREGDTLARIGGDEFVVILTEFDDVADCEKVLQRLLDAANHPVDMDDVIIQVSTSIGVTVYPQDAADADQLIRHADQAMYMAKQAGKNRFHWFDIEHDEAVKTMHESIEHVKQGLLRHEFDLYYQPKVNMRTGECIGVEALIRWLHPERGVLPPALFLPTIENNEFSVELGDWVITHALEQISAWQNQGLSIPISINISAYELQQSDFVERLEHRLKLFPEVDPGMLELEILETSALEDIGQISDIMINSHKLGVRFALDDFGTGYSSLTYLKRLPANSLKIDQSFVRDMIEDKDDLAIVEGVIGLAKAFNRDAIAEGVESSEHGEMLIELGCEYAQGYGIAKPMPAKELSVWLSTWRPPASWTKDHFYTI